MKLFIVLWGFLGIKLGLLGLLCCLFLFGIGLRLVVMCIVVCIVMCGCDVWFDVWFNVWFDVWFDVLFIFLMDVSP